VALVLLPPHNFALGRVVIIDCKEVWNMMVWPPAFILSVKFGQLVHRFKQATDRHTDTKIQKQRDDVINVLVLFP
jgi:hypothetical protein